MPLLRYSLISILLILVPMVVSSKVNLGFKGEHSASVGIYVKDIHTGEVIAENNATMAMTPASTMKLVTAATALSTLPNNFRFETKVSLTGEVNDGVCNGNLIITSCADPTIDSGHFSDRPTFCNEICDVLNAAGIKEIKGAVIVEETLSDPGCIATWEIEDVPWSYGAGLYGFNFLDNTFTLWPATKKTEPVVPNINVKVVKSRGVNLRRGIDSNMLTVYGPKPSDKNWRINTTMNNPAEVFAYNLTSKIKESGIAIGTKPVEVNGSRIPLFVHKSPDLNDVIRETLVYSHNMFAEGLLRALAPDSTLEGAIARELQVWRERGFDDAFDCVLDGSGLSRGDRLQPILLANLLEWMAKSQYASDFVGMLPLVGEEGTVRSFLKDTHLKGRLALKTGSMNAVQCYAGYKFDDKGRPSHVVVILVNSFRCDRSALRSAISEFLLKTFPPTVFANPTENE